MKRQIILALGVSVAAASLISLTVPFLLAARPSRLFVHSSASRPVATRAPSNEENEVESNAPIEAPAVSNERELATTTLFMPPIERLAAMAGDPPLAKGEVSVRVPVLMYHQIRPVGKNFTRKEKLFSVSPQSFGAQMQELVQKGYTAIAPDDLEAALRFGPGVLPSKPVLITFDDGYRNQFERAFPVLKRLGIKATFFIVSRADIFKGFMSDAMVKELDRSSLITIASHTQHHPMLGKSGRVVREHEIRDSKSDLETLLGHPIKFFAYPYGSWSVEIAKEVEEAGYELGFGVRLGSLHTPSSKYQLRRIRVLDRESVAALGDRFLLPLQESVSIAKP